MAIKSNYCYLLLLLFQLSILVYVMILIKIIYEKLPPRMYLKKINYVGLTGQGISDPTGFHDRLSLNAGQTICRMP